MRQRLEAWWLDCGTKDDLLAANRRLLEEGASRDLRGSVDGASRIIGPVVVDDEARIEESEIRGPVIIGPRTIVERSVIGPYTSIGPDCRVVESTVERCMVLDGSVIRGQSHLADSIVGPLVAAQSRSDGARPVGMAVGARTELLL